jgi:hypothetical protein
MSCTIFMAILVVMLLIMLLLQYMKASDRGLWLEALLLEVVPLLVIGVSKDSSRTKVPMLISNRW